MAPGGGGGGALSSYKLMGMCRGMDSHCHDSIDQNWVIFLIVIRIGSRIFGILGVRICVNLCYNDLLKRLYKVDTKLGSRKLHFLKSG